MGGGTFKLPRMGLALEWLSRLIASTFKKKNSLMILQLYFLPHSSPTPEGLVLYSRKTLSVLSIKTVGLLISFSQSAPGEILPKEGYILSQ